MNIDEEEGVEYYKLKGDEWDLNPYKLEPQSRALPLCYHHHKQSDKGESNPQKIPGPKPGGIPLSYCLKNI